jgi:hypothetical protein
MYLLFDIDIVQRDGDGERGEGRRGKRERKHATTEKETCWHTGTNTVPSGIIAADAVFCRVLEKSELTQTVL